MTETRIGKESLLLYFIMGSQNTPYDPLWVLQEAIRGGITCFQFREKGEGAKQGEERVDLAKAMQEICKKHHLPYLIDDDVQLALFLDADGVHIGQEDEDIHRVREKIGKEKILGVSVQTVEEALIAQEEGADYLGVGPIYPTSTKKDAKEAVGPLFVRKLREAGVYLPMVGIGGIRPGNALPVIREGADGIAIISSISQAENPGEVAIALRKEVKKALFFGSSFIAENHHNRS
ncbi:MAG: thiamine phosphate synthase [Thermicanus sp.]|nr:thiamine phosphate synthase [Thermicanus sp.]